MAVAFVNRTDAFTSAAVNNVSATAANHTAGNLIWVFTNIQLTSAVTITDTALNTYTEIGSGRTQGANTVRMFYAKNITGHATNVVKATWTGTSSGYSAMGVRQFSGCDTVSPLDGSAFGNAASGTAISSGTVTITGTDVVICAGMEVDGQPITGGSGYTKTNITGGSGFTCDEYHIVTASEAATATGTSSGGWVIGGAAFKATSGRLSRVSPLQGLGGSGQKLFNPSLS